MVYEDGQGTSKEAVMKTEFPVRAKPAAIGSPDFGGLKKFITVTESTNGAISTPITATDPNNDNLTYRLKAFNQDNDDFLPTGDQASDDTREGDVNSFSIDWATGQVSAKSLNFERNTDGDNSNDGKYLFIVTATDPGGPTSEDDILVTVTATDVNEKPSITAPTATMGMAELRVNEMLIDENGDPFYDPLGTNTRANPTADVVPNMMNEYMATDQDATGSTSWDHRGVDANAFDFGVPGVGQSPTLSFKEDYRPDYEAPKDTNRDNVYHVTLIARDSVGNLEDTMDVTVFVVNRKEAYDTTPPEVDTDGTVTAENAPNPMVVEFSVEQPQIGVMLSAGVADPDGGKEAGGDVLGHIDYTGLPGESVVGRRRDSPHMAVGAVQERGRALR